MARCLRLSPPKVFMEREQDSDELLQHAKLAPPLGRDAAIKLRDGVRSVQKRFIWALLICSAGIVLCYPRMGDKPRTLALRDLAALDEQLDVEGLRRALVQSAEQQQAPQLHELTRAVGLPMLGAPKGTHSQAHLFDAEAPDLSSLEAVARATRSGAEVAVRGPSFDALALSLRWRLERARKAPRLTLTQLQSSQKVDAEAVRAEARVTEARIAAKEALGAYERAREKYYEKRDVSDVLVARGASQRAKLAAVRERVAAYEELERRTPIMHATRDEYDRLANAALKVDPVSSTAASGGMLIRATLRTEDGDSVEYKIPVAIHPYTATTFVPVPPALARLQQNPLWTELKTLSLDAATTRLQQELSWHFREAQLAGLQVGGIAALQVLPLILCFVMWQLTRRCHTVARAYSPVGFAGMDLTDPGTGRPTVDRFLLIAPPTLVFALVCWTLLRLDTAPWIAAPLCFFTIMHSVMATHAWRNLHALCAGARHTSLVKPLPERPPQPTA